MLCYGKLVRPGKLLGNSKRLSFKSRYQRSNIAFQGSRNGGAALAVAAIRLLQ